MNRKRISIGTVNQCLDKRRMLCILSKQTNIQFQLNESKMCLPKLDQVFIFINGPK